MAWPNSIGITESGYINISGISISNDYYRFSAALNQPMIVVSGTSNLTNLEDNSESFEINLLACAIPSGSSTVAPTGFADFKRLNIFSALSALDNNKSFVTIAPREGGNSNFPMFLSGNALYDIYAAYAVVNTTIPDQGVVITDVLTVPSHRTLPPTPSPDDLRPSRVSDAGVGVSIQILGVDINGRPQQRFIFKFDQLKNFNELDGFAANGVSGFMKITAQGLEQPEQDFYTPSGTQQSTPFELFIPDIDSSGVWTVPKFANDTGPVGEDLANNTGYQGYAFKISYLNFPGEESPQLNLTFTSEDLKNFYSDILGSDSDLTDFDFKRKSTLRAVNVEGNTYRKRLAMGIRDIDMESVEYSTEGKYISKVFNSDSAIYAISLDATEQFPFFPEGTSTPWDFVRYYVQFGAEKSDEWERISTASRGGEIDASGVFIPKVLILDSLLNETQQESVPEVVGTTKFIKRGRAINSFRIRIDFDTVDHEDSGFWSPLIYDYSVKVLTRDLLSSTKVETNQFI